jgi:hypothetical protein
MVFIVAFQYLRSSFLTFEVHSRKLQCSRASRPYRIIRSLVNELFHKYVACKQKPRYLLSTAHFKLCLLFSPCCSSTFSKSYIFMAPRSNVRSLTRRLLTLRRTAALPEIVFKPLGSILGTPLPSQVHLKDLDILSPEHCSAETREAVQHFLDNAVPRWRWISSPMSKLQKSGRTQVYKRAWTRFWKREIGKDENFLIIVERETLDSVEVAMERPFSQLELEERLRRVKGTTGWGRSKTLRQKLWKRPLAAESAGG